eukprot:1153121-Pelagomonas_calceolata.AAC.1
MNFREGMREARVGLADFWQHVAPGHQGYGHRQSHPHPENLCGKRCRHPGVACTIHCIVAASGLRRLFFLIVAARLLAGNRPRIFTV